MKKALVLAMVTALAAGSAAAAPAPSHARRFVSRIERCSLLDKQLETVLKTKRTVRHATTARALRSKARRLCATHREAQGIRTYADALKLLGVQPNDDRRMRSKTVPHSKEKHR